MSQRKFRTCPGCSLPERLAVGNKAAAHALGLSLAAFRQRKKRAGIANGHRCTPRSVVCALCRRH